MVIIGLLLSQDVFEPGAVLAPVGIVRWREFPYGYRFKYVSSCVFCLRYASELYHFNSKLRIIGKVGSGSPTTVSSSARLTIPFVLLKMHGASGIGYPRGSIL